MLRSLDNRRSYIQIVYEILRLLRLGEAGKTEVMYTVKLSHSQMQRYLTRLSELNLLDTKVNDRNLTSYRITEKGLLILTKIENLQEVLRLHETTEILDMPEVKIEPRKKAGILSRVKDTFRNT